MVRVKVKVRVYMAVLFHPLAGGQVRVRVKVKARVIVRDRVRVRIRV
jgi:hypothetical protein